MFGHPLSSIRLRSCFLNSKGYFTAFQYFDKETVEIAPTESQLCPGLSLECDSRVITVNLRAQAAGHFDDAPGFSAYPQIDDGGGALVR